ncbi:MAG: hypothetical protein AAF206_05260 [Bacteroidota bacterium]
MKLFSTPFSGLALLAGILSLLCFSCKSQEYVAERPQIQFGTGGGFTGWVTTYYLMDNGQLYVKKHESETYESVKKVDKATVKKVFAFVAEHKLGQKNFRQPDNMYQFITFQLEENAEEGPVRVVWSEGNKLIDQNMKDLYGMLSELTQITE